MTDISSQQRGVAKYTALAFGVDKPPIFRFFDESKKSSVFILEAENCPQQGVVSYATVGLSDTPLIFHGKEFGTRVEVVGACGSVFPNFDRVLATLAFCVINSGWFCAPGMIFPDAMSMYKSSVTMNDIYFANPFLWDGLKSTDIEGRKVAWLLAVPISKAERKFAQDFGPDKLEALFAEKNIDIYNLNRDSVI